MGLNRRFCEKLNAKHINHQKHEKTILALTLISLVFNHSLFAGSKVKGKGKGGDEFRKAQEVYEIASKKAAEAGPIILAKCNEISELYKEQAEIKEDAAKKEFHSKFK